MGTSTDHQAQVTTMMMMMMPCSENSMQIDNSRVPNLDAAAASFCWDSIAFSDYNYQLINPLPPTPTPASGFHITPPDQPSFFSSFDQQYVSFSSSYDTVSSQFSSAPPVAENGLNSRQVRKRAAEVSSMAIKSGKRKKSSANSAADQGTWHHCEQMNHPSITLQEIKMPVRRSQKMSDKITALQKLVSPYGKTDTASVLEEASLCIKLLHKHIQMLSHGAASNDSRQTEAWTTTTTTTIEESDGEVMDLRSRGLCLVPLSVITKKFADQCLVVDPSCYPEE